jgi:hypothetical protein
MKRCDRVDCRTEQEMLAESVVEVVKSLWRNVRLWKRYPDRMKNKMIVNSFIGYRHKHPHLCSNLSKKQRSWCNSLHAALHQYLEAGTD